MRSYFTNKLLFLFSVIIFLQKISAHYCVTKIQQFMIIVFMAHRGILWVNWRAEMEEAADNKGFFEV
jgi:hypothetical protein